MINIDNEWAEGILCTAIEGGINYWAEVVEVVKDDDGFLRACVAEEHTGSEWVGIQEIKDAIGVILDIGVPGVAEGSQAGLLKTRLAEGPSVDLDAGDCDIIFQMALFREVFYG